MIAELQSTIGGWVWVAAGSVTVIAGLYAAVKWARKQLKDAIFDDIHPLLSEIGLSVNNVRNGEPKLIDRVKNTERLVIEAAAAAKQAESMALEATTAAKVAASVAEANAARMMQHFEK